MRDRGVNLVKPAQTDKVIATDGQTRGGQRRNGPHRLGVIRVID